MEVPQEIIDDGRLIVFIDTPNELEKAVLEHNKQMKQCAEKMKVVRGIETFFLIFNPLAVIADYAMHLRTFFANPALAAGLLILYFGVGAVLGIGKRYLWSVMLVTVPLLMLDLHIAFVIALDIPLLLWYNKTIEPLRTVRGFPDFHVIRVTYEKRRKPQTIKERETFQ